MPTESDEKLEAWWPLARWASPDNCSKRIASLKSITLCASVLRMPAADGKSVHLISRMAPRLALVLKNSNIGAKEFERVAKMQAAVFWGLVRPDLKWKI